MIPTLLVLTATVMFGVQFLFNGPDKVPNNLQFVLPFGR